MNLIDQVKTKWKDISYREQVILVSGVILALILLIYEFIVTPIQDTIYSQQQQLQDDQETLQWMQSVIPQIQAASPAKSIQSTALLSVLQNQLASQSFKTFSYQLGQSNATEIDLKFPKVPFNDFMVWLWKLSQEYFFELTLVEVKKTDVKGVVEMHIVLKAKE